MAAMSASANDELIHRGRRFDFVVRRERLPDGSELEREIVRHPGAVVILGLAEGGVVMIRNHRAAVDRELWELPAGTLEPREAPEKTAARELEEETGYRPGRVERLGEFYTTPGLTDELMRAFVATDLEAVGQKLEAGERIEAEVLPSARVMELVDAGELMDGKSLAALWLAQRRGLLGDGTA